MIKVALMENLEKKQLEFTISELDSQIKRMADYIENHSESTSSSVVNTLRATVRHRNSLVMELSVN